MEIWLGHATRKGINLIPCHIHIQVICRGAIMRLRSTKEFIDISKLKHCDKYDYSLSEYFGANENIKIICKKHGVFEQRAAHHMRGRGCKKCAIEDVKNKNASSREIVIDRFSEKHGSRYDYSLVEYKNSETKVIIICNVHGRFEQTPSSHISGSGCNQCGIELTANKKRETTGGFIEKSISIHGNKYDYDNVVYIDAKSKVEINCFKHGRFMQTPNAHLSGHGCSLCASSDTAEKLSLNISEALSRFSKTHEDRYDYSLVDYKNINTKVKIVCKKHGAFMQSPSMHISGRNCPKCAIESMVDKRRYSREKFIDTAKSVHGSRYSYDMVEYINNGKMITIICKNHGEFRQTPNAHIAGHGCKKCGLISALRLKYKKYGFNSYSRSDYIRIAEASHGGLSKFYIVKLKSEVESFFKIGISVKGVTNRFTNGKPYNIDSFIEFRMNASEAWDMEKHYLKILKDIKYRPNEKFGGSTECFWYIPSCVYDAAKAISKTISGRGDIYDSYTLE